MFNRSLAGVVLVVGLGATSLSQALSLGDMRLNSALNQPLDARIKLRDTGNLSSEQITVKLASVEDFEKAGVDFNYLLSKLNFVVEIDQNGNGVVKVISSDPIVEPYLNFLVEARWPAGRMLREYTVLLDLPAVSNARTSSVSASQGGSASQAAAQTPATREEVVILEESGTEGEASTGPKPRADGQRTALPKAERPTEYRVQHSDMLWDIAERYRPEGATVQQTMLALLRKNPRAFIGDNINRLKSGYVLRLPTLEEAQRLGQADAVKEIRRQNAIWRGEALPSDGDNGAAPQLDATPKSSEETKAGETKTEARLSIATPGSADSEGSNGAAEQLRNELAANQEDLDKVRRENEELGSRLEDLERQLATLQRLLELKDDQLATLQQQMGADNDVQATAVQPEPDQQAKQQAKPDLQPEPIAQESLLDNPAVKYGVPGVLLLGLIALLLRRVGQNKTKAAFDASRDDEAAEAAGFSESGFDAFGDDDSLAEDDDDDAGHTTLIIEPNRAAEPKGDSGNDTFDDFDDLISDEEIKGSAGDDVNDDLSETISLDPSSVEPETDDALAEAEIYVAYGRYEQAAQMLKNAIGKEPGRTDLRTKLLSVYLETRDKESFVSEFHALEALGDQDAVAEVKENMSAVEGVSDWLRENDTASDALAVDSLSGGVSTGASGESADSDDFDFDLEDDFGDTLIREPAQPAAGEQGAATDDSELDLELDDFNLDDELEASLESAVPQPDTNEPADVSLAQPRTEDAELDDDELAFDLDLDDDFSLDSLNETEDTGSAGNVDADKKDNEFSLEELSADLEDDSEDTLILSPQGEPPVAEEPAPASGLTEVSAEPSAAEDDDFSFDLDDELSLDTDSAKPTETLAGADQQANEDEFSFDLDDDLTLESTDELSKTTATDTPSLAEPETASEPGAETPVADPSDSLDDSFVDIKLDEDDALDDLDSLEDDMSDDLGLLGNSDEVATKLDLARAYIDMGDAEGAREMLEEVLSEGNEEQKQDATELLSRL